MNIFLGFDLKCLSDEKIKTGRLGGTERFFLILETFLKKKQHNVTRYNDNSKFDVAIYSNSTEHFVTAKKHICWCGSFLSNDAKSKPYDLIIANSHFMLETLECDGVVISACFEKEIPRYRTKQYIKRKVITTSNPNRHIQNTNQICNHLENQGVQFDWIITGGNKLYSDSYFDHFNEFHSSVNHKNILNREDLLREIATSHLYCYPNFSDNSETQCVSAIEASVLGLPVILPNRKPFTEILPDNPYFCNSIDDMVELIKSLLYADRDELYVCNVTKYSEANILPRILIEINNLFKRSY